MSYFNFATRKEHFWQSRAKKKNPRIVELVLLRLVEVLLLEVVDLNE